MILSVSGSTSGFGKPVFYNKTTTLSPYFLGSLTIQLLSWTISCFMRQYWITVVVVVSDSAHWVAWKQGISVNQSPNGYDSSPRNSFCSECASWPIKSAIACFGSFFTLSYCSGRTTPLSGHISPSACLRLRIDSYSWIGINQNNFIYREVSRRLWTSRGLHNRVSCPIFIENKTSKFIKRRPVFKEILCRK